MRNKVNTFATDAREGQATYNLPYGHIYANELIVSVSYNFRQQLILNKTFAGEKM